MKIEKCPFCGGTPILELFNDGFFDYARIRCCRVMFDWCGDETGEQAIAAWNRRAEPEITGNTSDGYHTFNELYHHRAILFSVICNDRLDRAWKSKMHHDGTMYDGMFIVGINTPDGQATYHYDIDPYWDMFRVPELSQAPKWDGHTPAQAIERIGRLTQPENKPLTLDADEVVRIDEAVKALHRLSVLLVTPDSIVCCEAADLIESLQTQLSASQQRERDARNELCLSCGKYREAHKGACDGCRWKEMPQ